MESACECLPNCDDIQYIIERRQTDQAKWVTLVFLCDKPVWCLSVSSDRSHFVFDGKGDTIVVGFTSNEFYPTIKERQFTEIDFVSYLGGTLGLFAGFSVLTAFEVLSHIILPFCSNWLKRKRRPKVFPMLRPLQAKIKTRRSKFRRIIAVASKFCYSYVENSSLHGVSHAALENMGWFAKVLWLTLFVVSIGFCSVLLAETLQKYQQGSVVLSLDDQFHKIQSVSVSKSNLEPDSDSGTDLAKFGCCWLEKKYNESVAIF